MKFAVYAVVRVKGFATKRDFSSGAFNLRSPQVGDIATIVEIYTDPPGYELECSDSNGITQWLVAFGPEEIELELAD